MNSKTATRPGLKKMSIRHLHLDVSPLVLLLTAFFLLPGLPAPANQPVAIDLRTESARAASVHALTARAGARKQAAIAMAMARNWPLRGVTPDGRVFELIELNEFGQPMYYITMNRNAAISTAANLVRSTAPYNLSGNGLIAGVWDGGAIRSDHQEFVAPDRVIVRDGALLSNHATHVGGTIGAKGHVADALGMAPAVTIHSYDWNNDLAEMVAAAAREANQTTNIYISNHSYGFITGWEYASSSGNIGWHWYGVWPEREARGFGQYSDSAWDWDKLCYSAPYFLPFKAAGNDRSDGMPGTGATFYYYDGGWKSKTYDPNTDPFADQHKEGGYNTISHQGVAKNLMTVGAVDDAVSAGSRSLANASMTTFSCWGPADDGRIKPDIVANGVSLYSSTSNHPSSYGSGSGTSMAAPNAAGSALLLSEYYRKLFPDRDMRAATLKGLIIHTADDLGRPGPDYQYGWGLMNTKVAADHILNHYNNPDAFHLVEDVIVNEGTNSYVFFWDGEHPIRATLCWTDPAGPVQSGLNSTTRVLVHDLDMRIIAPDGSLHFPYALNHASYTDNATFGDNVRDNVEQVYIASPDATGLYTVRVSHKGVLTGTGKEQSFSMSLSGSIEMPQDYAISGYVRNPDGDGIPGVTMSGLPGMPTTDGDGYYDKQVASNWSGSVMPYKEGYAFDPGSRDYENVGADRFNQNFVLMSFRTNAGAIYAMGDIPTDSSFAALPGVSACPGTIVVAIPEDVEIVGVDTAYNMTTANEGWMSEQRSWLRCVSPGGVDESGMTQGSGNAEGTYAYERTGLTIANDVAGGGNIEFELHAGRTWGGSGCSTTYNKVDNSTWVMTVHYCEILAMPAPTGVAATDGTSSAHVRVSWDSVTGATHYQVSRATSVDGAKTALGAWQTGTTYDDTEATPGVTYYYFVRAAIDGMGAKASTYSDATTGWRYAPNRYTLSIASEHGAPLPAVGVYTNDYGTTLTNRIGDSPVEVNGTQYIGVGWTMSGHAPQSGASTQMVMTVTNDAVLTWLWEPTVYQWKVSAGLGGSITGTESGWYEPETIVSNTAIPREDCLFWRWTGAPEGMATNNPLVVNLTNDYPSVKARFRSTRPGGFFMKVK